MPGPDADIQIVHARDHRAFEQVANLFVEYAESLGWDLDSSERFANEIKNLPGPYAEPAGTLLLACASGSPIGVLGLEPVPADVRIEGIGAERFGELKRLFVRDKFRRRGIARALMEQAEREARERGYEALVLTTSAELMPLAQGLYEQLEYVDYEPYRTDMPWPDLRWMRLDL